MEYLANPMNGYGLSPEAFSMHFPHVPPGFSHPSFKLHSNPVREKFFQEHKLLDKRLEDFQEVYRRYASGLLESHPFGIIPPTHPLYSRTRSIEHLKMENEKLQKENLELKKHLEQVKNTKTS